MPTYDYKCLQGHTFSKFKPMAQYQSIETCSCGLPANRYFLSAPAVRGDYAGYSCPVTGDWIEGRRAHEENLKRTGCRVLEPGETEACKRNRVAREAAFDAKIESSVEEFVTKLPAAKKEKLAAEMEAGVTAAVTRL